MPITRIVAQLRTTDMASSIRFYTEKLGFTVAFDYEGFYAGVRVGEHLIHLKRVDEPDPSIPYVEHGGHLHLYLETNGVEAFASELRARGVALERDVHETDWGTREFVVVDDQGHTLYFGEPL